MGSWGELTWQVDFIMVKSEFFIKTILTEYSE